MKRTSGKPPGAPPAAAKAAARGGPVNRRAVPRQATSYMACPAAPPDGDDPLLAFDPVPHKRPRRNSITPDKQRKFIAALAATGIVTQAAKAIGVSLEAVYRLRQRPGAEGFRAAWEAALDRGIARLEDCALQRALEGEERPVVSGGKWLGTWRRYDNNLLMFLLRHRLAARYAAEIAPGHPLYERIRAEVLAERAAERQRDENDILASINAKIGQMRAREKAVRDMLAEEEEAEREEAEGGGGQ